MSATYTRRIAPSLIAAATLSLAACGGHGSNTQPAKPNPPNVTPAAAATTQPNSTAMASRDTTTPSHHSKLAGAALGAAAGHVVGGKKGMIAGAVIGAEVQHHRNKVAQERAAHP